MKTKWTVPILHSKIQKYLNKMQSFHISLNKYFKFIDCTQNKCKNNSLSRCSIESKRCMRNPKQCHTHNQIYKKQQSNLLLVHFVCMARQSLRYLFQNNIKRSIMKFGVLKGNTISLGYSTRNNRQSMVKNCSQSPLTNKHYFLVINMYFFTSSNHCVNTNLLNFFQLVTIIFHIAKYILLTYKTLCFFN